MTAMVITIDGPSASGKGTVASLVAQKLDFAYLDSGALYRLSALHARNKQIDWTDESSLAALARDLPVKFGGDQVFLENIDVSAQIRLEEIGMGASKIAALPQVRQALLERQRDFLVGKGLVTDGRDMGSVVFPKADLKIFLTASAEIRAQRRYKQLNNKGESANLCQIEADIVARDKLDASRVVAPLRQEADAKLLDTSNMTVEQAVAQVMAWYEQVAH